MPAARWPRRLFRFGTAFLVIFAVVGFFEVDSAAQRDSYYDQVSYTPGPGNPYADIRDVYVYDGQGRLQVGVQPARIAAVCPKLRRKRITRQRPSRS